MKTDDKKSAPLYRSAHLGPTCEECEVEETCKVYRGCDCAPTSPADLLAVVEIREWAQKRYDEAARTFNEVKQRGDFCDWADDQMHQMEDLMKYIDTLHPRRVRVVEGTVWHPTGECIERLPDKGFWCPAQADRTNMVLLHSGLPDGTPVKVLIEEVDDEG